MIEYIFQLFLVRINFGGLVDNLKKVNPEIKAEEFIKTVLQWFYLASFWGLVKGNLTERVSLFCDIATKETGIDKRAFQLVLVNLNTLVEFDSEDEAVNIYVEGLQVPSNMEMFNLMVEGNEARENQIDDRNFWLAVGTTLEPIRGSLEAASNFGNSILSGSLGKTVLFAGVAIIAFKLITTKKA